MDPPAAGVSDLRLSLGEALTMLAVHEQRHLLQAERVTREPGFPRT